MDVIFSRARNSVYRPLSTLSKSTIAALIGVAVLGIVMWLSVKDLPFFIFMGAMMVICAALVFTKVRWIPFLSSAVCLFFLYFMLVPSPFAINHLTHPKDTDTGIWFSYTVFVIVLSFIWFMATAAWVGISTGIQNYLTPKQTTMPGWFASLLAATVGLLLGAILIAAIIQPGSAVATIDNSGDATVHMSATNFDQTIMVVSKGKSLTLVNDGNYTHIIANGTWSKGQAVVQHQTNQPAVNNVAVVGPGKSLTIGPFNTAGTYHFYCTVHPGMNLTIAVR
jgi:plastocyanin